MTTFPFLESLRINEVGKHAVGMWSSRWLDDALEVAEVSFQERAFDRDVEQIADLSASGLMEDFLEVGPVLLRDGGEAFHEVANIIFRERFLARLKMSEVSSLEWLGPAG